MVYRVVGTQVVSKNFERTRTRVESLNHLVTRIGLIKQEKLGV